MPTPVRYKLGHLFFGNLSQPLRRRNNIVGLTAIIIIQSVTWLLLDLCFHDVTYQKYQ